jgi:lipopolysaccharide export system permease protein
MRLLDRYLLRELLVPLGYCLGGFLVFWISFDLLTQLEVFQQHKLHGSDVVEYYFVKAPEFLMVVLPIALLLALLYALTNHARHYELTAMRAAGVSLWRLCLPYLAVGFGASLVLFALNELWVPNSAEAAERILNQRLEKRKGADTRHLRRNLGFTNSRDGRTWQIGAYNLKTHEMIDPKVDWRLPDGSHRELIAKRAARTSGVWTFYEVWENVYAPVTGALTNRNQAAVLPLPEFHETPDQIQSEIKISERLSRRGSLKSDIPLVELLNYLRLHPHPPASDKAWLHTKLHGRLAAPWTCLVVVLIAIPFGAGAGRRNVFVGVASSVFICFAFFILLQLGLALGSAGHLPPWLAAWFPNLSFGATGTWLTARVR